MLYHSIYSVRDKKKVNAEVIDIREIEGAKGVRFQIVGRHPEDGTTVTTFCSATVAEDYKEKMSTLPHGLSAESIEVAQDHIPASEATVISTDGTPVDDDLETFVEDPLVGSPSEGTLTSAKVMAAEGELSKTSCCCGATEDKPCACMTSDEPMQCSSTEPKCACYAAKGAEGESEETTCPCSNCGCGYGKAAETVAGIDIQTPSQIAIETPDSDELLVPDPDHLASGDGRVLGQQSGKVNTTPMHAEGDERIKLFYEGIYTNDDEDDPREGQEIMSYSLVSKKDYQEYYEDTKYEPCKCDVQGCLSCFLEYYPHTPEIKNGVITSYGSLWFEDAELNALDAEDGESFNAETDVPVMVTLPAWNWLWCEGTPTWIGAIGSDKPVKLVKDDFMELEYADDFDLSKVYFGDQVDMEELEFRIKVTDQTMLDSLIKSYGEDIKSAETDVPETMSPKQALEYLKSGDNCVWLVGYSAGQRDYPIEEAEELATLIEEGVFEEDSTLVIATKLHKPWSGDAYNPDEFYADSYEPGLARNPKVLIPTAVIGGLALAYLAKPELLSGSLDKISSMLSSLTKKGDKTE